MSAGSSVGVFQYAGPAAFSYFDVGSRWDEPLRLRPQTRRVRLNDELATEPLGWSERC